MDSIKIVAAKDPACAVGVHFSCNIAVLSIMREDDTVPGVQTARGEVRASASPGRPAVLNRGNSLYIGRSSLFGRMH